MDSRWWGWGFAGVGLMLVGIGGWHLVGLAPPTSTWLHDVIDIVLIGGSGSGLLYGGYWHATRSLPEERYPRIAAWMVGSGLMVGSLSVVSLYVGSQQITWIEILESAQLSVAVGLVAGVLVGTIEAQSISNAEAAASARARADTLQETQARMEELNDLLRHYTLNGMNLITGYTAQLRSVVPAEHEPALDTIEERARTITTLIEHIGSLPIMTTETASPTPVDLGAAIDSSLTDCPSHPEVSVIGPSRSPDVNAYDELDETLALLFDAIMTVTDAGGTLEIVVDPAPGTVTLRVRATPAELSEAVENSLFEPIASGVGLELYLTKEVLEQYGEFQLTTNTGMTLEFELRLDRPQPPGDE